jgi:hypothetical protein
MGFAKPHYVARIAIQACVALLTTGTDLPENSFGLRNRLESSGSIAPRNPEHVCSILKTLGRHLRKKTLQHASN